MYLMARGLGTAGNPRTGVKWKECRTCCDPAPGDYVALN